MTKKELVEKLNNYPDDTEVIVWRMDDSAPWSIKRTNIDNVEFNHYTKKIEICEQ